MKNRLKIKLALPALLLLALTSCKDTPTIEPPAPEKNTPKLYNIFISYGNENSTTSYYTLSVSDLLKDTIITPIKSGLSPEGITSWSGIYSAVHGNNFYYTEDGNVIKKQRIENGRYKEIGNLVAKSGTWDLGMMKTVFNANGLNFLSWAVRPNVSENVIEKDLYIVDTARNMSIKSVKPLKIPVRSYDTYDDKGVLNVKTEDPITPSSFSIHDNKLFMGYLYSWDLTTKNDTTYMLICDYPSLENAKLLKDARQGHVSGRWSASSSSFLDERGDYYFTTRSNNTNKFGFLRIRKGQTVIDPEYTYSFDIGSAVPEDEVKSFTSDRHVYLKNGLAFIGGLIVDVYNKKIVKNISSLGMGKVQGTMDTFTEDQNPYVILKTDDARWFVAKYNVDQGTLQRGIEIKGATYVQRIARVR